MIVTRRLASLHDRRRTQGGFSLMEVLLVVSISSLVALPVLAWMITGFKSDATVKATTKRTLVTTMMTQALPRDLSDASEVLYTSVDGELSSSAPYDCSDGDGFVAVSVLDGARKNVVVYAAVDADGFTQVERRECPVGLPVADRQPLGEPIRLGTEDVLSARARYGGVYGNNVANGVDVTVSLPNARPVEVSGTLRTGADPSPTSTVVGP